MARRARPDASIGDRIRTRRELHGWSIRHAADRAGLSSSTWSRIERGLRSADNRFVIADIARALNVPVADLTGQPATPQDTDTARAQGYAHKLMQALVEIDLKEEPTCGHRPIDELRRETALVVELRSRCDETGVGQRLPRLLRELHAAAASRDRQGALALLVEATFIASGTVRYLGRQAEAWLAAERCQQAAEAADDPVLLAVAGYTRAHAAIGCDIYPRGLLLATRAADAVRVHMSATGAPELYGQLLLTTAFAHVAERRPDDAEALVAEAELIAGGTGETDTFGMYFGPTNVRFWRVSMDSDGGEPGRAVRIARDTTPSAVRSVARQAAFYVDTARALSRVGNEGEALRMLLTAERLATVRVHSNTTVYETARGLLSRPRRNVDDVALRAFCERLGLSAGADGSGRS